MYLLQFSTVYARDAPWIQHTNIKSVRHFKRVRSGGMAMWPSWVCVILANLLCLVESGNSAAILGACRKYFAKRIGNSLCHGAIVIQRAPPIKIQQQRRLRRGRGRAVSYSRTWQGGEAPRRRPWHWHVVGGTSPSRWSKLMIQSRHLKCPTADFLMGKHAPYISIPL